MRPALLVRDLAGGGFLAQHSATLIDGTGNREDPGDSNRLKLHPVWLPWPISSTGSGAETRNVRQGRMPIT
jgi:hypothetical protein